MPFVVMRRTDIPDTVLQLTDLKPNDSQRNLIYDPPGQTKYVVNLPQQDTLALTGTGPIVTVGATQGLAAYLVDRVENQTGDVALTATEANDTATALIAIVAAGTALTEAVIAAELVTAGAGATTSLTFGNSTGVLTEVLGIVGGRVYLLPAGSQVEDGVNAFDPAVSGSFTNDGEFQQVFDTSAFKISNGVGQISKFKDATFNYLSTTGAAIVVYADDGSLL